MFRMMKKKDKISSFDAISGIFQVKKSLYVFLPPSLE